MESWQPSSCLCVHVQKGVMSMLLSLVIKWEQGAKPWGDRSKAESQTRATPYT